MSPTEEDSTGDTGSAVQTEGEAGQRLDTLRERLGEGDAEAFEQIFRRLSPAVFCFVRGMVQGEALAHHLTQDTFAKLWDIRERMTQVDSVRAYIFQIARNRVYNQQRNEQVRRENRTDLRETTPSSPPSPDTTLDTDMLRAKLEEWIADLPDRQREALALRRRSGLDHEEIAAVMDISPNTVNNHIVRAMKNLRGRLREHRPDLLP